MTKDSSSETACEEDNHVPAKTTSTLSPELMDDEAAFHSRMDHVGEDVLLEAEPIIGSVPLSSNGLNALKPATGAESCLAMSETAVDVPEVNGMSPKNELQPLESAKAGQGEEDDGNLSDGTDIDEFEDMYQKLMGRAAAVQERTKQAPKRVRQQKQYAQLLEDRIDLLEKRWELYEQKVALSRGVNLPLITPAEPEKSPKDRGTSTGLNPQYWEELYNSPNDTEHPIYTIDVLIGEPKISTMKSSRTSNEQALMKLLASKGIDLLPNGDAMNDAAVRKDISRDVESLRAKRMPERIRINSVCLRYILAAMIENGKYIVADDRPVILLRPFKPLLKYEAVIRRLKASLDEAASQLASATQKASFSAAHEGANPVPLPGHSLPLDTAELITDDNPIAKILTDLGAHPCASCCAMAQVRLGCYSILSTNGFCQSTNAFGREKARGLPSKIYGSSFNPAMRWYEKSKLLPSIMLIGPTW